MPATTGQIRRYGWSNSPSRSNKFKDKVKDKPLFSDKELKRMLNDTIWANGLKKAFGYDPLLCKCGTQMILNFELSNFNRKEDSG